jgi:hypothetical protein
MNRTFIPSPKASLDDDMVPNVTAPDSNVKINQQIILTKDQFELLKIISKAHDKSISEYIEKAVLETMKNEIEYGDFCDILLDKLDSEPELT